MTESESHRILVVDDEPDITALVAYHLAKAGYRVITAVNGRDALRTARQERPDLVVLDLMLPGVSGYDVLAELRRREETKDLGVILLTARKRARMSRTASRASRSAPTTISRNRSPRRSSSCASARCCAAWRRRPSPPGASSRPGGSHWTAARTG